MLPFITTYTGKKVNPLDVKMDEIDMRDIAHSLSCITRFNGHLKFPVSVASHCIRVALHVPEDQPVARLQALLHDASEAYLGDVTKWLKMSPEMAAYREAEERVQRRIYRKFKCPEVMLPIVEEADRYMVRFEALRGLPVYHLDGIPGYEKLNVDEIRRTSMLRQYSWQTTERDFLNLFNDLAAKGGGSVYSFKTLHTGPRRQGRPPTAP